MDLDFTINCYVVENNPEILDSLARDISQKASLLQIVKSLGITLTQDDERVRAKATHCLTDVVKHKSDLKSPELDVLSLFFTDRLHDNSSIEAAAEGFRVLTTKDNFKFPDENSETLWEKLGAIDMLNAETLARYQVYCLLQALSRKPCKTLVDVFTSLSSGEKDPRNLRVNLETSHRLLQKLGPSLPDEQLSNLYDVSFCYFPIKFNPPKNVEVSVTSEELREALRLTLSHSCIAKWVIPGLISKLAAVNTSVKLDTLSALKAVVQNLKDESLLDAYWLSIWGGLKLEVLQGTAENETHLPAIEILRLLTEESLFLDTLTSHIDHEAMSETSLCRICHLALGLSTSEEIWQKLSPKITKKCYEHPHLLKLLLKSNFGVPYPDQVFQALLTTLANGEKRESLSALTEFALKPEGNDYAPLIVHTLSHESAFKSLAKLAHTHATNIQENCLPFLLSRLPGTLDALAEVCCEKSLVHTLTRRLLSRMDLNKSALENEGLSVDRILDTLLVSTSHLKAAGDFTGYDKILVPQLLEKFQNANQSPSIQPNVVNAACVLLERAARGVLDEQQAQFSESVLKFLDKVHFHLILSALAPMKNWYFGEHFISSYILPHLEIANDFLERAAYLRLLALAANKWSKSCVPHSKFESFMEELQISALDNATGAEVYAWLTKGLVFKADQMGFENARFLAEQVSGNKLIAKVFGVLLADDRLLTKGNGCTVRPLFRQRLFVLSLPIFKLNQTKKETLMAVSSLVRFTPQIVVASHFTSILPMLISGLNTSTTQIQESALSTIKTSFPESSTTIKEYVAAITPRIISLSSTSPSTSVRILALEVLIALHSALPEAVAPYKVQVLDKVSTILDHRKREVRRVAAKCRQAFY